MKKVAVVLCNDMHMDIAKANTLLNTIIRNEGFEVACDYTVADVVIVITCAFGPNKMYSVRVIADVRINAKKSAQVIVTGCLLKLNFDELSVIPGITVEPFEKLLEKFGKNNNVEQNLIPQNKVIISEGCLHNCSYCVYPKLFSGYKSKPIEKILEEIANIYDNESTIYITGAQETSDYGVDLYGKRSFDSLLEKIVTKYPNCNYVIGWFHPAGLTDKVISIIAKNSNIVEIMLHIQHVDEEILKKMNRPSFKETDMKIQKLKEVRPDLRISTEVIVGFPGETKANFNSLVEYLGKGYFSDIGVASFESVLGTRASLLRDKVSEEEKNSRMKIIRDNFYATTYPADEETSNSIIEEYYKAYQVLRLMPKNILKDRQEINLIAGVDTKAKLEDFESHLSDVFERITNSRTEFEFQKNLNYVMGKYTDAARVFFFSMIEISEVKEVIKQRARMMLLQRESE